MTKKSHQVKSRFYYIFWGTCTAAVVLGQIYVGSGYRQMKYSVDRVTGVFITLLQAI